MFWTDFARSVTLKNKFLNVYVRFLLPCPHKSQGKLDTLHLRKLLKCTFIFFSSDHNFVILTEYNQGQQGWSPSKNFNFMMIFLHKMN